MLKLNNLLFVAIAALGAQLANAGVVVNLEQRLPPFGAPDAALTGFTAYQVGVATNDGALISAVDVSFSGQMHQRWNDTDFDGVADPSPTGAVNDGRGDTHLTLIAGALIGSAPTENNNVLASPLPDLPDGSRDYGIGDSLSGAWGIPGPNQTNSATIAYLVIPDGQRVTFNWSIAAANGTFTGQSLVPNIPEPASLAMVGMSLIGLVLRRRIG